MSTNPLVPQFPAGPLTASDGLSPNGLPPPIDVGRWKTPQLTLVATQHDLAPDSPLSARRGPSVVMIESTESSGVTDRLLAEMPVVARLGVPFDVGRLHSVLEEHHPRFVLCTHSFDRIDEGFLNVCRLYGAQAFVLAEPVYGALGGRHVRRFGGLPWLAISRPGRRSEELRKRLADLTLIGLSAVVTLPLMLIILLATSCTGRPLYFQTRVGLGGRTFRMVKFRTMVVGAEADSGPTLCTVGDLRVTRLGQFLRRSRLDELPQLWNVLRGQMSLVGPRPERPEFIAELRRLPHYELRELMRPGLTGIAQLTGGYEATAEEKLRCDLLYLHIRSLHADLALLVSTAVELFRGFPRG